MSFETVSKYYSGQGVVMIAERDAVTGKPMGLVPVGNVSDLKISISTSVLEHKESQSGQRSIDLRLTTETKAALSMTLESFSKENLEIALRGTAVAKAGAAVTAEASAAYFGKISPLQYAKVSAVAVKAAAVTLTAFTVDGAAWDYKLNADAGSFMMNDGSIEAFALLGTGGALAPTSGTVGTTTTITVANTLAVGQRVVVGGVTGTGSVVINGKLATVLTASGTNFTVDIDTSTLTLVFTAAKVFVEGGALTVDYTYAAQNVVDALTEGATDRYLRFEGLNTADDNKPVVIEVFKFSTDPLKELSLIGDTVGQFALEGNVLADALRTSGSKFFKQTLVA